MTSVDQRTVVFLICHSRHRQVAARRGDDAPGDAWADREPVILPPPAR